MIFEPIDNSSANIVELKVKPRPSADEGAMLQPVPHSHCRHTYTLAADKRAVSGGGIARTVTKIQRHGDSLIGMTGCWDTAVEMREWFKAGADPDKFPASARLDKSTLIVIDQTGIKTWWIGPYPFVIEQRKCAWGTGRDYAEAAMYLGRDAVSAVEVAIVFQTDCGNGCDFLRLEP